mmetsp:Transcript_33831/g.78122  ORF Transcript_33831/g.78122 Transcript_33831/m.78122 type:complete len:200 (+) Transcript_33831:340-939(+)
MRPRPEQTARLRRPSRMRDRHGLRRHFTRRQHRHGRGGDGRHHRRKRCGVRGPPRRKGRGDRQQGSHRRPPVRNRRHSGGGQFRPRPTGGISLRSRRLRRHPRHSIASERFCRGLRIRNLRRHQRMHQLHADVHGPRGMVLRRCSRSRGGAGIRRGGSHSGRGRFRRPFQAAHPHASRLRRGRGRGRDLRPRHHRPDQD